MWCTTKVETPNRHHLFCLLNHLACTFQLHVRATVKRKFTPTMATKTCSLWLERPIASNNWNNNTIKAHCENATYYLSYIGRLVCIFYSIFTRSPALFVHLRPYVESEILHSPKTSHSQTKHPSQQTKNNDIISWLRKDRTTWSGYIASISPYESYKS